MKRAILALIALFSLLTIPASAQIARWGITGGMNVSKINWKNVDWGNLEKEVNPQSEKGWYAGITGKIAIPVVGIGIDGGLVYSQEGVDSGIENYKSELAHSICIPLHLRYDLEIWGVEDIVIPFAMIGPQFNFAMNDLKFKELEGHSAEYIINKVNSWRLDMGLGCILFNHLQIHYSYGIPMGDAIQMDEEQGTASFNYKLGTHRLGAVYYF